MANWKRKKNRRKVKCVMCTPFRWGNKKDNASAANLRRMQNEE